MRVDHLTFGQLYRLASPENLCRVTKAYHKWLRRFWDDNDGFGSIEPFSVGLAQAYCPIEATPWCRVLAFLRDSELRSALRRAAKDQVVPYHPGYLTLFRTLNRFIDQRTQSALGSLIVMHCKHCGVPAHLRENTSGDYCVFVESNEAGCAVLTYKPGLKWSTIKQFCDEMNVSADRVFWWLPEGDRTGWRINPSNWPVNTPDFQKAADELVYKA